MTDAKPFLLRLSTCDGVLTVHPVGELDVSSAETVRQLGRGLGDFARVVLDLAELTFIDSSGIGALVELRRHVPTTLLNAVDAVRRPIEVLGLGHHLGLR